MAKLEVTPENRDDIGVIVASSGGSFEMGKQEQVIAEKGANRVDPLLIPRLGGASEAIVVPVAVATMAVLGALTKDWNDDPLHASRPFDAKRSGFVLAQRAGMLVLEAEERALARGAPILFEFAGAGWSFDATDDTAPD